MPSYVWKFLFSRASARASETFREALVDESKIYHLFIVVYN